MTNEIRNIAVGLIDEPQKPMRIGVELASLEDLVASIRSNGLINPITVRREAGRFRVVAGHRRTLACRIAGLTDIPCVIADLTDDQAESVMAAENLERKDTDPVEEALFVARLVGEETAKIPDVAKRLNRSVAWVEDRLNILNYPDYMIAAIREGNLSLGVAKWLGLITDDTYRKMYVQSAILNGMKVSAAEYYYNLFACGGLQPVSGEAPPQAPGEEPKRALMSVDCARCGKKAVEPNFVSVFIHRECPAEKPEATPA